MCPPPAYYYHKPMKLDQFNEGPPAAEHRGQSEERREPEMARIPEMSLEDAIAKFNVRFGTTYDVNHKWPATDLMDMSLHAGFNTEPNLSRVLYRYAEIAEEAV